MTEPLRVKIETTAHPDIIRVMVNRSLASGRPGESPGRAPGPPCPVVPALLKIVGVREVTVAGNRITVKKDPKADWRSIGPAIQTGVYRALH